eukprot:scaffold40844_cov48-Phaeocystis_antarctica.AAC.1
MRVEVLKLRRLGGLGLVRVANGGELLPAYYQPRRMCMQCERSAHAACMQRAQYSMCSQAGSIVCACHPHWTNMHEVSLGLGSSTPCTWLGLGLGSGLGSGLGLGSELGLGLELG